MLKVVLCPNQEMAVTNCVYTHNPITDYVLVGRFVYRCRTSELVAADAVAFNKAHRLAAALTVGQEVLVQPYSVADLALIPKLHLEIDVINRAHRGTTHDVETVRHLALETLRHHVCENHQRFVADLAGAHVCFRIIACTNITRGFVDESTEFVIKTGATSDMLLTDIPILKPDFNFEMLGIGGLHQEFHLMFRRAFASRIMPAQIVARLGIRHVRGILLSGPPGTGKTLMARQIAHMLKATTTKPKIVSGPEILNKYVGESEKNIRELFADAERDREKYGAVSPLHTIIFDEIDAICRARGMSQCSVGDTVVNQLLAKIDGVDALDNILIIGMTNRPEVIDPALTRPGRLEVHIEISLPDLAGRLEILKIHTQKMAENNFLAEDVDLDEIARQTQNFTGADLEGLVKNATSYAINREIDADCRLRSRNPSLIRVFHQDFEISIAEIHPNMPSKLKSYLPEKWFQIHDTQAVREFITRSESVPLVRVLVGGAEGTGKTALAADLASIRPKSQLQVISPATLVGMTESAKTAYIINAFQSAYVSQQSVILIDDIHHVVEYVAVGPRFSNGILQTIRTMISKPPSNPDCRVLIIGTVNNLALMQSLGMASCFDVDVILDKVASPNMIAHVLTELDVGTEAAQELAKGGGATIRELTTIAAVMRDRPDYDADLASLVLKKTLE